ncbi:hypothetical protein QEN19_004358 [Hanseniaspora menglaensis]
MDPILTEHVLSLLGEAKEKTLVSKIHNNSRHEDKDEVQAFAKLSGRDWTYYISSLRVSIGRGHPTDLQNPNQGSAGCDIDLRPAKIVSRKHAEIVYNQTTGNWELHVNGRNGAKINFTKVESGPQSPNIQLFSGTIIDINGTQMMFILPDTPPMLTKFAISSIQQSIPIDHSIYSLGFPAPTLPVNNDGLKKPITNNGLSNIPGHHNTLISSSVKVGNDGASLGVIVGEKISKNAQNFSENYDSGSNGMDQDLSLEEHKNIKPSFSYATLITQAFLSTPEGEMALADIYKFISDNYAYYRFKKPNWQNSVRHNLSLNKAFERVDRRSLREMEEADETKKQDARRYYKWRVSASFQAEFIVRLENGRLGSLKRGTSIVNQLHRHYSIHGNLPIQIYYPQELLTAYNELMGANNVSGSGINGSGGLTQTSGSRKSQITALTQTANKIEKAAMDGTRTAQSNKMKHNIQIISSYPNIASMANLDGQTNNLKPIVSKPAQPLIFPANTHMIKVEDGSSSVSHINGSNSTATSPNKTHLLLNAFQHQENLERETHQRTATTPARPLSNQTVNTIDSTESAGENKFSHIAGNENGSTAGNNIQELVIDGTKISNQQPYSGASNTFSPGVMNLLQFSSVNNTPAVVGATSNLHRSLKKSSQKISSNLRKEGEEEDDDDEDINSSPLKRKKQVDDGLKNNGMSNSSFFMPNVLDMGAVKVIKAVKNDDDQKSQVDK